MKRLTEKDKQYCESPVFNNLNSFDTYDFSAMLYSRLQEFENFLEEKGFESLEELKHHYSRKYIHIYRIVNVFSKEDKK